MADLEKYVTDLEKYVADLEKYVTDLEKWSVSFVCTMSLMRSTV